MSPRLPRFVVDRAPKRRPPSGAVKPEPGFALEKEHHPTLSARHSGQGAPPPDAPPRSGPPVRVPDRVLRPQRDQDDPQRTHFRPQPPRGSCSAWPTFAGSEDAGSRSAMSLISRRRCLVGSIWFMLSSHDGLSTPKLLSSSRGAANGGRFCLAFSAFLVIGKSSERPGQGRAVCALRSEPLTARTVLEHGAEGRGPQAICPWRGSRAEPRAPYRAFYARHQGGRLLALRLRAPGTIAHFGSGSDGIVYRGLELGGRGRTHKQRPVLRPVISKAGRKMSRSGGTRNASLRASTADSVHAIA
jgi:hypothetical protein